MELVVDLIHMDAREGAPRAADEIEAAAAIAAKPGNAGDVGVDDVAQPLFVVRVLDQAKRPERQGGAFADLAEIDGNELDAAAAEIADDAVGLRNAGNYAERRQATLGGAIENVDGNPATARRLGDKGAPVACIAHGGGGD